MLTTYDSPIICYRNNKPATRLQVMIVANMKTVNKTLNNACV